MSEGFWINWFGDYKHREKGCDKIYGTHWHISNEEFTEHAVSCGVEVEREECPECW